MTASTSQGINATSKDMQIAKIQNSTVSFFKRIGGLLQRQKYDNYLQAFRLRREYLSHLRSPTTVGRLRSTYPSISQTAVISHSYYW